jgi:hypothetical protein
VCCYKRQAYNATNENEKIAMDRLYSGRGMNPFKSKHWFVIYSEPREEDRSKPEKGLFWRKQANASKYGAKLRGWGATE